MKGKMKRWVRVLLILAVVALGIAILTLQIKRRELERERDALTALLEQQRTHVEELNYNRSLPREDYIEKYAREVLGYHKEKELIFKFEP